MTYMNSVTKNKLRRHKIAMIGDSFLRGIRENVELSLSDKFGIYSMVKPGCELNTLLESANSVLGSLTQRDIILICGGANDFNSDKGESSIDRIVEFIKTNNHTNIVLTNVPVRYDFSYYSQENKGIRSFNKKLMEITKEHKQVALKEIDMDRKYHTRHGLHFNKLGKLLFSNKIAQAIYSILGKELKQSTVMSEKYGVQGDESEIDGRNSNQGNKDISNDRNSEERLIVDEDESTRDNNGDKNDEEKFRQINSKVIVSKELDCDGEEKGVNKD